VANKHMREWIELGAEDLRRRVVEMREELFHLRFKNGVRQLDNPLKIRDVRKQIARAETQLRALSAGKESGR
jgi:large subunit ribosomal protein L29